jgi:diguanylate cyclase (GGDEF)-like protein/PAS domain S-box-containing protein
MRKRIRNWHPGDDIRIADDAARMRAAYERGRASNEGSQLQAALVEAQAIAHIGSFIMQFPSRRTTWTDECFRILGLPPNSIIPSFEAYLARIHPDDRAVLIETYDRSLRDHAPVSLEQRVVRMDGTVRIIRSRWRNFYGGDDKPVRTIGTVQDITEAKASLDALRAERDFSAVLIDGLPGFFALLDDRGRLVRWNKNLATLTGLADDELRGRDGLSLIAEEDRAEAATILAETFRNGRGDAVLRMRGKAAALRSVRMISRSMTADGVVQLVVIGVDITDLQEAQSALRQSEQRLAAIFNSISDGIAVHDPQTGAFIDVNSRLCEMFGYPRDELMKRSLADLSSGIAPYGTDEMEAFLRRASSGEPLTVEWLAKAKDGHTFWVEISGRRAEYGAHDALLSVTRDITARRRDDQKLREDEAKFRGLVEQNVAGVAIMRDDGAVVYINPYFAQMMGYDASEVIGRPLLDFVPEPERAAVAEKLRSHLTGEGGFVQLVSTIRAKDGHIIDVIVNASPTSHEGRPASLGVVIDITEQQTAQRKLATIVDSVQAGILMIDPEKHEIVEVNPAAAKMFGAPREAIVGARCQKYVCPADIGKCPITDLHQNVDNSERVLLTAKGVSIPILKTVAKVTLAGKVYLIESFVDITDRKRAEAELAHMARTDALTGLNNRRVFVEALERAVAGARRDAQKFAVLYLDLDHFKDVNDALGHPIGDLLLREIAQRLAAHIRKSDTVARFGGDEFALIASGVTDPVDAAVLAQNVLDLVSTPCAIEDKQLRIGASIGIAYHGNEAPAAEVILSQADMALYNAKKEGRGTYRFFTAAMDAEVRDRVTLGAELREAIVSDQLFLLYQPQIDIDTGRILGLEALVRWNHPTRGIVPPDQFIPITEHVGIVVPLGRWVLRKACRQMRMWLDAGIAPPLIAVNISAAQFTTPMELERDIAAILAETGLQPGSLELELTETVLMTVSREHSDDLARLHRSGLRIAIDDFGTGFSSLAYLSRLPVNRIKIAQTFIRDLTANSANAAIVRAAIGVAHELGLDVIVEGVETADQLELIKSWNAHKVQGFYFAKPLPAEAIAPLLRAKTVRPAA